MIRTERQLFNELKGKWLSKYHLDQINSLMLSFNSQYDKYRHKVFQCADDREREAVRREFDGLRQALIGYTLRVFRIEPDRIDQGEVKVELETDGNYYLTYRLPQWYRALNFAICNLVEPDGDLLSSMENQFQDIMLDTIKEITDTAGGDDMTPRIVRELRGALYLRKGMVNLTVKKVNK